MAKAASVKIKHLGNGDLVYRLKKALQNESKHSANVKRILTEVRSRNIKLRHKLRTQLEGV